MPNPAELNADEALALSLGLTPEEWQAALRILDGRSPSQPEVGVFGALWSERRSRKSSRIHLQNLPAEGPRVLQGGAGPGRSAGVIDIGDGQAVAFALESRNHACTASPYQGAAASVAGALMDVFTTGARPMANLNALRFGEPDAPGMRDLIRGVTAGLGGHGNCMGVPMLAGDTAFAPCYSGNLVVNTFTLGVRTGGGFQDQVPAPGSQLLVLGARTGRDGLPHPEPVEGEAAASQPSDPFTGKLVLEACLEIQQAEGILTLQGMGAAGLAGCAVELAARAGAGLALRLDEIPVREEGMLPFDLLLSETQERLLVAVQPGLEPELKRILHKWGLEAASIGEVTDSGRLVCHWQGETVVDLPIQPLADAPALDRPQIRPAYLDQLDQPPPADLAPEAVAAHLDRLLASPNLASKRWIFGQYDDTVRGNTLLGHGSAGSGLFRIPGTGKAIALKTDGNGRFAWLDPFWGAAHAVAEACRNLACVGAEPIGIAPCLNYGDPGQPETMWALAQGILGIRQACLALDVPVVCSGVSLGNVQDGQSAGAIHPTPVIGAVGLIEDCSPDGDGNRFCDAAFQGPEHGIFLLGETRDELGGSEHQLLRAGSVSGACPELRLDEELQLQACVREGIRMGLIRSAQDTSEGGLLIAVLESAFGGNLGCRLDLVRDGLRLDALLFGESAGRIVVSVEPDGEPSLTKLARTHRVPLTRLGTTGGPRVVLRVDGQPVLDSPASRLKERYASALEASLRD